ncbi:unnamed protein product [Protopolystoma xenopodis]|uniref:Uncharacterized protein n=1 Tax=Protopolystoma xenopodis TaxID=117903 RepID=A0A3S4ZWQ7_9PLAT|nr:unnamed protein product [Protopolystoma xenopodis]
MHPHLLLWSSPGQTGGMAMTACCRRVSAPFITLHHTTRACSNSWRKGGLMQVGGTRMGRAGLNDGCC